jgi:hypothetical protein
MARGWESKAIEDQISAAEAKQEARLRQSQHLDEIEREKRKESLQLERTRLIREIESTRNNRYRLLLQRSLDYIETELERFAPSFQSTDQKDL